MNDLKLILEKYAITQSEVAEKAGVSRQYVSHVLNNRRNDRQGVLDSALSLVKAAQRKEEKRNRQLSDLIAAADLMPAA